MADDDRKEKEYKVEDRRASSGSGDSKDSPPEPEPGAQAGDPVPDQETGPGSPPPRQGGEGHKVDFSTFIFSLFSSALIQMGEMADPISGTTEKNLTAAKQTIDIIDILKVKTEGNLSEEESKLVENASAELKWKYLDTVKRKD